MEGRQTAFPGIWVEQLKVETPPFDEPGVIQEFVGQGVMKDIEPLQKGADFSGDTVGDFIESAEDTIGPFRDEFRLHYTLLIRTRPRNFTFSESILKRTVSSRGRLFVRTKNPFEPEIIGIREPVRDSKLSDEKLGDVYKVVVTVTK